MEINDTDPVVPVLSYANPLGGQPLDSRLVVEQSLSQAESLWLVPLLNEALHAKGATADASSEV